MKAFLCLVVLPTLFLIACGSDKENSMAPAEVKASLIGQVFRGPIEPVSVPGNPNAETFAATFHLLSEDVEVLVFRTGSNGNFRLDIAPGDYVVVPDEDAPILFPQTQTKEITVPEGTVLTVRLDFDTGIR